MIEFSPDAWSALLAQTTSAGRAQALSTMFSSGCTLEFHTPTDGAVRTVAVGPWSAANALAIPGAFTDPATGEGDWFEAVWKDGSGNEVFRCTVGVGAGDYQLYAAITVGVPVGRGALAIQFLPVRGEVPTQEPIAIVGTVGPVIEIKQGETFSLAPYVTGGEPPYTYSVATGTLPAGVMLNDKTGVLLASASAQEGFSPDIKFRATDSALAPPVNAAAPEVSGTLEVDGVLSASTGAWDGAQLAFAFQWLRNGAVIDGQTAQTYTLTADDLGAYLTVRVTATNAANVSSTASSLAVGPVIDHGAVSAPVNTAQPAISGTLKVGRMLLCSTGEWLQAPVGFAYQWVRGVSDIPGATSAFYWLTAADEGENIACRVVASNANGDSLPAAAAAVGPIAAADVVTPGALPLLGLVSEVGGLDLPFSIAHPFGKGDVPAGKTVGVASGLTSFQCVPISTWPDGSLRLAWLSGHATLSAGVRADFQLQVGDAGATVDLGLSALRSALTSSAVTVTMPDPAVNLTIDLPTLIASEPFDIFGNGSGAIFTGPECSSWVWRTRIAGAAHLELWVPIRYYSNGAIEVNIPWLQNGDLLTASPRHYAGVIATLTLNGTLRFDRTFEAKNKRIVPLVAGNMGAERSYWSGTNPKIRPVHDTQYLRASRMVPSYRNVPPSESTLNGLRSEYTPNMLGDILADTTRPTFDSVGVLPRWCALHLTSAADKRAFDCLLVNSLCGAVRPVHYRDNTTGRYLKYSQYPQACLSPQATPIVPIGSLGAMSNTYPDQDVAHQPSYGYYPWMITGDLYFLESQLAYATWNYLYTNWSYRRREKGVYPPNIQERGVAWGLRTLTQLCVALPDSHILRGEFLAVLGHNVDYQSEYMPGGGRRDGGYSAENELGFVQGNITGSTYTAVSDIGHGTNSYASPWQQSMQTLVIHQVLKLEPETVGLGKVATLFAWSARRCIAVAGGNSSGWPYTRFGPYAFPTITPRGALDAPGGRFLSSFAECWGAWSNDLAMHNPNLPLEDTNPAPGGVIMEGHKAGAPMDEYHFSRESATAIPLAALACAAEEDLPGAVQGWNNVTGATNFSTSGMHHYPMWAFAPRNL